MDELDLIRGFRQDVPAPSPAARERAVRELRAASGGPRRPRLRIALPAAGAAAAAGLVAVLSLGSSGRGLTPEASAAERLREVAAVAERQPYPRAIGPGQFWYQRSIDAYLATFDGGVPADGSEPAQAAFSAIEPQTREQWIGRDSGGRVRTRSRGEPRFPGPRDRERWLAAGSPQLRHPMDVPLANDDAPSGAPSFSLGQEGISYDELIDLPTDTDRLYARLRRAAGRGGGSGPDDELFTIVGDLLRGAPIPSDLRGALYRVAARVPGIRAAGDVRDAAGRRGVGILRDDQGVRRMLIFDPATGELLGERDVLLEPTDYVDAPPGAVIGEAAYLDAGVVDSTRERP